MTEASGGRTGTKGVAPPQSPEKAASPATKYSPSPKKEKEGKKADIKKIVIVLNPDALFGSYVLTKTWMERRTAFQW